LQSSTIHNAEFIDNTGQQMFVRRRWKGATLVPGPIEIRDEAFLDRVFPNAEDDRNNVGCRLRARGVWNPPTAASTATGRAFSQPSRPNSAAGTTP
jgi:hypothetical protein